MNKSIMFILLELFTIRYYSRYSLSIIKYVRDFVIKRIKKYDDLLQFKLKVFSDSVNLPIDEFLCVRDFISYLNSIDKIIKF